MSDYPAWLAGAAPATLVGARRARWGFRHETWVAELEGGRRVVLQRRVDGSDPTREVAREVRRRVRAAGVPTPEPGRRPPSADDGAAIVVELPYVDALVAAELLGTVEGAATVGRLCGTIAARLGAVDRTGLVLAETWTSGARLRPAVDGWLAGLRERLPARTEAVVRGALARAESALGTGTAGLAHGDLAPVNVLVDGGAVAAVLDLDRAQPASPLYDAAWFAWVVTFHHPAVAGAACAAYGEAAGVTTGAVALGWVWPLLLLERLAEATDDTERATWTSRLVGGPGV